MHSLSSQALFDIVANHGAHIGKMGLAPHDLRRTYAQIGLEASVGLPQISKLLGHASLATTQKYVDMSLDLETTISDFVPVWPGLDCSGQPPILPAEHRSARHVGPRCSTHRPALG